MRTVLELQQNSGLSKKDARIIRKLGKRRWREIFKEWDKEDPGWRKKQK